MNVLNVKLVCNFECIKGVCKTEIVNPTCSLVCSKGCDERDVGITGACHRNSSGCHTGVIWRC